MANLKSIIELAYAQLFPNPTDEEKLSKIDFLETARGEYSYQFLLRYWKEKGTEGVFNMPAELSTESEFDVVDNEIDISELDIMSRLPDSRWLQNIGGLTCDCKYIKSDINKTQLLCDDDSLPDVFKTYLIVGKKIKFPMGTHKNKLTIIYANSGREVNDEIEVDDSIGAIVRTRLVEIYGGKIGNEDKTNNTNGNG